MAALEVHGPDPGWEGPLMDQAMMAEALKEGWAVFDTGGGRLEIQMDDERGMLGSDDEALEAANLFLARKVVQVFGRGGSVTIAERVSLLELATAILNTEKEIG